MSARDYLPLLTDSTTIVRTLRQKFGEPRPSAGDLYVTGQDARTVDAIHPRQLTVRVAQIRAETPSTKTLVLEAAGRPLPPYLPGQYVNVFATVDGVRTSRPLSISSVPGGGRMELTIRRKAGGFVSGQLLDRVQTGDLLTISAPEGDFHHTPVRDGDDLVFIAAGSGITPFMGLLEQLLEQRPRGGALLLYGNRTSDEIIFFDRISALARRHPRFKTILTLSAPGPGWVGARGRIDAVFLHRHLADTIRDDRTYFVCGPPAMERAVRRDLEQLGVPRDRIRVETRSGPATAGRPVKTFTLRLEASGEVLEARSDEPLLNSMERAGRALPALCRSGSCGACRSKLVGGQVKAPPRVGRRASDVSAGYIHPCVCYPTTDVVLRALPDPGRARLHPSAWRPTLPPVEPATLTALTTPAVPSPSTGPARPVQAVQQSWLKVAVAAGGFACVISVLIHLVAT